MPFTALFMTSGHLWPAGERILRAELLPSGAFMKPRGEGSIVEVSEEVPTDGRVRPDVDTGVTLRDTQEVLQSAVYRSGDCAFKLASSVFTMLGYMNVTAPMITFGRWCEES